MNFTTQIVALVLLLASFTWVQKVKAKEYSLPEEWSFTDSNGYSWARQDNILPNLAIPNLAFPKMPIDESKFTDILGSGQYEMLENDTEEIGMQMVLDMIFNNEENDNENSTFARLLREKWLENAMPNTKDRPKKSNSPTIDEEDRNEIQITVDKIKEILKSNSNASFQVVNGKLVITQKSDEDDHKSLTICNVPFNNLTDIKNFLKNVTYENTEVQTLLASYKAENLTKQELMDAIRAKGWVKLNMECTNDPTTKIPPTTVSLEDYQMAQLRHVIDEGYLDESVIQDLEDGKVTMEELETEVMQNREFVLSRFPNQITTMLEDNRIPDDVVVIMFAGNQSMSEVKFYVYQDDTIAKAMLPERIRDILETRDPPQELKNMIHQGYNDTEIAQAVMSNATLMEEMMSESMFYFFNLFQDPQNVAINMALSGISILALCSVMTSLGCTMTVTEIMKHVKRPKGVIIALLSQYGIMPLVAFGLTQLFDLDVYPAISVLICGCCPGGNLSNMLAFAINGDMNLSILMTTCSSVFGLGMMPLLLFCYSRYIIPVDSAEIVPFDKIILNVALTIVPVTVGITIKHFRPTWTTNVMRFGAVMLLLCSIAFCVLAGFLLGDKFFYFLPPEVVYCAAILPMTGYIFGFCFARLVRENQKCSRTISVETGCQNVQLCGTVLKLAFDPILVGVMILLPIIYMAFQAGEAILLITIYRLYERWTGKKLGKEEEELEFEDDEKDLERSDSERKTKEEDEEKKSLKEEKVKENDENDVTEVTQNGVPKDTSDDEREDEAIERWPLVGTPDPNYLDSFKNAGKENYV